MNIVRYLSVAACSTIVFMTGCGSQSPLSPRSVDETSVQRAAIGDYIPFPGRVEAEDFNLLGEGVGYHDLTSGNTGGAYRTDDVDIETCSDVGGGHNVGWIESGEWLRYNVTIPTGNEGVYRITARVASGSSGEKAFRVVFSGRYGTRTQIVTFTHADGWQNWHDVTWEMDMMPVNQTMTVEILTGGFNLNYFDVVKVGSVVNPIANAGPDQTVSAGSQVMLDGRMSYDPNNAHGGFQVLGFSWSQVTGPAVTLTNANSAVPTFTPVATGSYTFQMSITSSTGSAIDFVVVTVEENRVTLPGRLEAEGYHFAHDLTAGNTGGVYRSGDVDIQSCSDVGGGYNVGWIQAGEYLGYMVTVSQSTTFRFTCRVASGAAGTKSIAVQINGKTAGSASFTHSDGWQNWHDVTISGVAIGAGNHQVTILMGSDNFNLNYVDVSAQSPSYVALMSTANNRYISVRDDNSLLATASAINLWEQFVRVDLPDGKIALRSMKNNSYVCADQSLANSPLVCNRPAAGGWESFTVVTNSDGTISLLASNGRYVCAENGGSSPLVANRPGAGGWEKFRLITQ